MSPKISIVVPFCGAEISLAECLESLAGQSLSDLEVVMVDDGSADSSAVIAKSFAERDPRFRLVQQENQGPGPARNTGIGHATGEYLAFANSGDLVAKRGYELLAGSLEKTGSDLAAGNVMRAGQGRIRQSRPHAEAFTSSVAAGHITRRPELLSDQRIWNKVYRRSFWDEHGLAFSAGRHEEAPVALRAHVLASAVDVLEHAVYYWREAPADGRRDQPQDLLERVDSVRAVCDLLAEHAPELSPAYLRQAVRRDLKTLIDALPKVAEPDQERLIRSASGLLAGTGPRSLDGLPAIIRLRTHLLGRGMLPELLEVAAPFDQKRVLSAPVVRRGRLRTRWYARYPFFEDPARAVPAEVFDVTGELTLKGRVDQVRWQGDRLRVEGHAYIDRLESGSAADSKLRLWLQDAKRGTRLDLAVRRMRRPDVTADSNQPTVSYDHSGFAVEIDPARLRHGGNWRAAEWELRAEVVAHGLKRTGALGNPSLPQPKWLAPYEVADGVWILPVAGAEQFGVRVKPVKALVTGHRVVDGRLELDGWTRTRTGLGSAVTAIAQQGGGKVLGTLESMPRGDGRFGFRARLPLDRLVGGTDALGDLVEWDLALNDGSGTYKLMVTEDVPEARYPIGDREFALTRTRFGNLRGLERTVCPVVTEIGWIRGDRLMIAGDQAGGADRPDHLVLRHRRSNEEHRLPLSWQGDRFHAELSPAAMPALGLLRPMGVGSWELRSPIRSGEVPLVIERTAIAGLPGERVAGAHEVAVLTHQTDALHLRVRTALAEDERGSYAQERLKKRDYPRLRGLPPRDLVVFDSYRSRQYSCSPRGVYEELRRRQSELECLWVSCDGQFTAPFGARTVLSGGREHYEALARARYVVSNEAQPAWFAKRPGQTYVQCWHGTPLKRLGLDVPTMPHMRKAVEAWVDREVTQWDLLVSPSPFASPIMRRAYRYEGEILESGYPRNDLLLSPDRERIAAEVRQRLGIPAGKRVVLYVPTWRDNHYLAPGRRKFDLALDLERARAALGDDHLLLLRAHYLVTDRSWSQVDDFVVDVSRYPDIAELYLIADVLVTDYSSAMFDFAVTGRPMVFFTYDLELYRDQVRGFYFDFESEAPGPVLRTSDEVIEALRDIEAVTEGFTGAYAAFTAKFCPYDDGHAAERVIRRFLELGG